MNSLLRWWSAPVDYDWVIDYHRSHPVLRRAPYVAALFTALCGAICLVMIATPGVIDGVVAKTAAAVVALSTFAVGCVFLRGRFPSRAVSLAFVAWADAGIALVLSALDPTPATLMCTTVFVLLGSYAIVFHGARVFTLHQVWALSIVAVLYARVVSTGAATVGEATILLGIAVVVLVGASILEQLLLSALRTDAATAFFDPLTGLRNRRGLHSALPDIFAPARDPDAEITAVCIDLDGFKSVNDRYGHAHGDDVIRLTARRIHDLCPAPAVSARLGGEEFLVLLPGARGIEVAGRILGAVHDPTDRSPITASIGVALAPLAHLPRDRVAALELLAAHADAAMYGAKREGGHRVVAFDCVDGWHGPMGGVGGT